MLTEEGSKASMFPISTPEVIRFAISSTAGNLMPFPFCSRVHLRFLSTVSRFGVRLSVPPHSPTNLALIHTQFLYLYRTSWHSLATLTEVFPCFFLSCKANSRVKPAKSGYCPHSSKIFVFFCVLFVLCRSVYCLCVNVYCTAATGWLPNCS